MQTLMLLPPLCRPSCSSHLCADPHAPLTSVQTLMLLPPLCRPSCSSHLCADPHAPPTSVQTLMLLPPLCRPSCSSHLCADPHAPPTCADPRYIVVFLHHSDGQGTAWILFINLLTLRIYSIMGGGSQLPRSPWPLIHMTCEPEVCLTFNCKSAIPACNGWKMAEASIPACNGWKMAEASIPACNGWKMAEASIPACNG